MNSTRFHHQILELIRRTSAFLPPDVSEVIETHRVLEQHGSKADLALELVSQNIGLAKRLSAPICQDTGTITFYVKTPRSASISSSWRTSARMRWPRRRRRAICGRTPSIA